MEVALEVQALEARIKAQGIDLPAFWLRAGIHRSTWQRWRIGEVSPTLENWREAERAADQMIAERDAALPLQSDADLTAPPKPSGEAA